jgi:hypothetical protein
MSEARATVRQPDDVAHPKEGHQQMSTPVNLTGRLATDPEMRFSVKDGSPS